MRRNSLLILAATVCIQFLPTAPVSAQTDFTWTDGGFSITFPAGFPDPQSNVQNVATTLGDMEMTTFMSAMASGACMVAYSDYPADAFEGANTRALFDSARNGAINNVHGKLIREKDISLDGNPGRSVYFSGKSGKEIIYGRFDYYLVQPRLYQVGYMTLKKSDLDTPASRGFFSSFRLVQQAPPDEADEP